MSLNVNVWVYYVDMQLDDDVDMQLIYVLSP